MRKTYFKKHPLHRNKQDYRESQNYRRAHEGQRS